jgi:hypothetical protein
MDLPAEAREAAAVALWNLHAQTRAWDELIDLEKDQVRHEANFILDEAFAAFPAEPLGFCRKTQGCHGSNTHEGGCWTS